MSKTNKKLSQNISFNGSGYKSFNKKFQNSSFWLNEDFLSNQSEIRADIIKLASYKRAIANFVRIVTNRTDIEVNYSSGSQSYTDGKSVVISSKISDTEFDCTVGLALHEGSHIALSDFRFLKTQFRSRSQFDIGADAENAFIYENFHHLKELTNIIEDRRIDNFVYTQAPGYRGYYNTLYEKYFNCKEVDMALKQNLKTSGTIDDYLFHICNFANPNRQLDSMPGLRDIWNCIDLHNIRRLRSTKESFDVACDVMNLILKHHQTQKSQDQDVQDQDPQNQKSPSTNGRVNESIDEPEDPNLDHPNAAENDAEISANSNSSNTSNSSESNASDEDETSLNQKNQKKDEKFQKSLDQAIKKQKDFLNGDIKKSKLSRSANEKVKALSESSISIESVGGSVLNEDGSTSDRGTTNCIVVHGITELGISSNLYGANYVMNNSTYRARSSAAVNEGLNLGTLLGKRLKTRDEDRSLVSTRTEHGKIDRRLLAELGFGNERVFQNTIHYQVTPCLIHISIDGSGSMSGRKWSAAIKSTIAICKAASMVASIDVIVSMRTTLYYSADGHHPMMWIVFDSRRDSLTKFCTHASNLNPAGSTPEGLCFQAILKETVKASNGKDSFFINISDGEPTFANKNINYCGNYAYNHTKQQVQNLRKNKIQVESYFVHDYEYKSTLDIENLSSSRNFRMMYGADSRFIDTTNLNSLAKSLNNMFIRVIE